MRGQCAKEIIRKKGEFRARLERVSNTEKNLTSREGVSRRAGDQKGVTQKNESSTGAWEGGKKYTEVG